MAVQISSAHYKTFEPDANRSESELLADIEGMSSENIMQYLDEEFERHEEVTLKNEILVKSISKIQYSVRKSSVRRAVFVVKVFLLQEFENTRIPIKTSLS